MFFSNIINVKCIKLIFFFLFINCISYTLIYYFIYIYQCINVYMKLFKRNEMQEKRRRPNSSLTDFKATKKKKRFKDGV